MSQLNCCDSHKKKKIKQTEQEKKLSAATVGSDTVTLLNGIIEKFIRGEMVKSNMPDVFTEDQLSLTEYQVHIIKFESSVEKINKKMLIKMHSVMASGSVKHYIVAFGCFDYWVDLTCKVKRRRTRQFRKFSNFFSCMNVLTYVSVFMVCKEW